MAEKRDWAALGISWHEGIVHLDEARTVAHRAILPVFNDLDKLIAWLGKARVLTLVSGSNSPRVAMQAANRRAAVKGHGFEWVKEQFYNWAMRIRAGAVLVHTFPDGEKYFGENEAEYRAQYAAKLFDLGVAMEKAKEVAENVAW